MKKLKFKYIVLLLIGKLSLLAGNTALFEAAQNKNKPAISFTENKGQVCDQYYKPRPDVLYGAMAGNMAVHIRNSGVSYQLYRVDKWKDVEDPKTKESHKEIDQQTIYRVDLTWVNANKYFTKSEDEALPGYNNYYLESCPNGALNVNSYKGISLNNLYPGISLHYFERNGELKHDYIVAAHADYQQINIKVEGAEISVNEDGSLQLETPLGKIQEGAPLVYQNQKQLKARWVVENNFLSFEIENYNPNYELLIDPVTRIWGTYYGGAGSDRGLSCSNDALSNVYMTGFTTSNSGTIMATIGSHQSTAGSSIDAFLVKFNSAGQRKWGTYYGGATSDDGRSCCTDAQGNIYISGITSYSTSLAIATNGSHQPNFGGGDSDAFLVKFNSSGQRIWGTYYGGTGEDYGWSCSTDALGNVFLAGETTSSLNIVIATPGSHQSVFGGGGRDGYLVKFNSNGLRLWGTYYGTSGFQDIAFSCCTDAMGNIYLTGLAGSSTGTVIATTGSYQSFFGGGSYDVFLTKFNSLGQRLWGTYYGGTGSDVGVSCCTDASGNLYLTGSADIDTNNVIASLGSHQPVQGGSIDGFLVKFNASGQRQWGTYYGGIGLDRGTACSTDMNGDVYLAGYTRSNSGTVIATVGSHQPVYGGIQDAFVAKFNSNGQRQWGTYYGGVSGDAGWYCSTDSYGNVYLTGETADLSGSIIATQGSHQTTNGGGQYDAFLVKFGTCPILAPVAAVNSVVCLGSSLNFSVNISGAFNPIYTWNGPSSFTSFNQNPTITSASSINIGSYTVTVNNGGCLETSTTIVSIVDNCVGVNQNSTIEDQFIFFYPNPNNGQLNVELDMEAKVLIIDLQGRIVGNQSLVSGKNQISIEHLENGLYFLEVVYSKGKQTVRVIKQ